MQKRSKFLNPNHEVDFYDAVEQFIEVKYGKCNALEFAWFTKIFSNSHLKVINQHKFKTDAISGITLEDFLLE